MTEQSWTQEWRSAFGRWWHVELVVLGVLVAVFGGMTPLSDPDLPIHLATGEWVARHHALPFVEPWAWTRAGQPFQAYSWLIESAFYLALRAAGPLGVKILHGSLLVAAGAAMLVLGRTAGWRPRTALVMGALNLSVAALVACCVRPQVVLFSLVPLAWAFSYWIVRARQIASPAAGLFLTSALAANTHLLFPLTAAPWVLLFIELPREWRRWLALSGAVLGGWLLTPYVLIWPEIFRLNFASNPLIAYPSPLSEYLPGFVASMGLGPAPLFLILGVTLIPWGLANAGLQARAVLAYGALWLVGLLAFSLAARAYLVWWLLVVPVVGLVVERIGDALARENPVARHLRIVAVWAICAVFLMTRVSAFPETYGVEGTIVSRTLPSPAGPWVDPLARWLECRTRPGTGGKLLTVHGFGSYLIWRLPTYSASIDGRTIFPDSVARAETYQGPWTGRHPVYGPWRSAELAMVPVNFTVAAVLDTAAEWRRVAVSNRPEGTTALWVSRAWWDRVGLEPLPRHPQAASGVSACSVPGGRQVPALPSDSYNQPLSPTG